MHLASRAIAWRFSGTGLSDESLRRYGVTKCLRAELPAPEQLTIVDRLDFRRGFVDGVWIAYSVWCLGHAELRARFPITRVELTDDPAAMNPMFDYEKRVWWDVVAGDVVEAPQPDYRSITRLSDGMAGVQRALLAARWPGLQFSSPASRR